MDTPQNKDLEVIKEKIAKLLRKSDSAKELNSMAEAMAFANKANDLLMQYNLELSHINMAAGLPVEPTIDMVSIRMDQFTSLTSNDGTEWTLNLINVICKNNLCSLVRTASPDGNHLLRIIGTADNIQNCIDLSKTLIAVCKNLCTLDWKHYNGPIKKNKYRRDYLKGFPIGLHQAYMENKIKVEYYALVKTNEVALRSKTSELFPNLKSRNTRVNQNEAFERGQQEGRNIRLNKEIS